MASKASVCGICDLRHITRPSDVWCSECDEGLCLECKEHHSLSKATRNHNTVPISLYEKLPDNALEISQFCSEHKEKFQLYCKKHECPCCSSCVVSYHQKCQDLVKLNDMIRNVKKSYGFYDIEQTMNDMIENIQRIKIDRCNNLSILKEERKMIEKEIEKIRIKSNAQLDHRRDIIKELYEVESKESNMISQLVHSIEKSEKEIRECQENLIIIKEHASDLQTFLAMKQIERDIIEKDKYITSLVKSNKLNRVSLSCKMNYAVQKRVNEKGKLGEIIVSSHASEVAIVRKKEAHAQHVVTHVRSTSIDNLSFALRLTVDTGLQEIRGCLLLPDGRLVFSCYYSDLIRGFNKGGSKDFDITVKPKCIFDITYIRDNNTIAVTGGGRSNYISIIGVPNKKVNETIRVKSDNYGIVSMDKKLIYCTRDRGIQTMKLTDQSVSNIITSKMSTFAYVAIFCDKLYYTNVDTHTVTCVDLHGTLQWEFKDESVLIYPQGISVDNAGNVYVVGYWFHNVVVISADGQRHRQLLTDKDGLCEPRALQYDRSTNQLLVANQTGKAFLYACK